MASLNTRPIIFPLSNPVSLCEVDYADAIRWTNGSVLFASGSPYQPVEYEGRVYEPGQGNNMYIFPGIGLGTILSKAKHVTDAMVEQASIALAGSLNADESANGLMYPRLTRIRDISAQIALAVIRAAQKDVSPLNSGVVLKLRRPNIFFCRTWTRTPSSAIYRMMPSSSISRPSNGSPQAPITHLACRLCACPSLRQFLPVFIPSCTMRFPETLSASMQVMYFISVQHWQRIVVDLCIWGIEEYIVPSCINCPIQLESLFDQAFRTWVIKFPL